MRARRTWRALALVAALAGGAALRAQAPHDAGRAAPTAGTPADVEGRVVRAGGGAQDPVAGAWVVLHRVGNDAAGPLDSMRTGADGSYRFRYQRTGREDAIYFASTTYGGIAYFAPPFHAASVRGDDALIAVFDTTSAQVPMRVEGRHFVVSRAHDGAREMLEVYELANDARYTVIAAATRPVWSAPVPEGATAFVPGEGESARGSIELRGGRAELFAPVAPGLKQVSFRYQLPTGRFPVTVTLLAAVSVLEVLVEEPTARVTGATLREVDAGEAEGRKFRRFLAQDVPAGARFTVDPGTAGVNRRWAIIAGVAAAALVLAIALVVSVRRSRA